jgi:PAS domain S-box-containing protein
MYGYCAEEVIGKSIEIIKSGKNDKEFLMQIYAGTMNNGWRGRLLNKRKNGTEFLIELSTSVVRDENGKPLALVGVVNDLTEQIKTEEKLREAQDKYRSLFMELKDAVYESTLDGKFVELNPAGMQLFGFHSFDDFNRVDISKEFYLNAEEREKFKRELEKNGFVSNYEIGIKKPNGEIATVLETAMPVKNKKGDIIGYRGILHDITELKRNEARLKHLVEKFEAINTRLKKSEDELKNINASKDKFFSIIAHDLRSPFTSLLSFSEFLIEDIDDLQKEEIKLFAEKINESSKNVFSLLENLLQWSRIQTGKIPYEPITFNMINLVNRAVKLLKDNASHKNICLKNNVNNNSLVFADEDMIFSVVQNLLSNAIKFTSKDGSIEFNSTVKPKEVEISITDTGVGIKETDLQKLFRIDTHHTTYGTSDEKGSGLGLLLCKEMIERNRGKIWVISKVGKGTTFTFSLPKG